MEDALLNRNRSQKLLLLLSLLLLLLILKQEPYCFFIKSSGIESFSCCIFIAMHCRAKHLCLAPAGAKVLFAASLFAGLHFVR